MEYFKLLNLEREPFSNSPDPELFYRSRQHQGCLQKLEISLRLRRGLNVVIGDVGTGKTTLCRHLIRAFSGDSNTSTHLLLDPHFSSPLECLTTLAELFGVETGPDPSEWQLREGIKQHLFHQGVDLGKTNVLIVDEGQKIPPFGIEILRELLNYETNEYKLLQIVIFAQDEFRQILAQHPNFADRINLYYHLTPLGWRDTVALIRFRIEVSQAEFGAGRLFTWPGFLAVYRASGGYPRRIINLCHQVLLAMIVSNRTRAGWGLVQSCHRRSFRVAPKAWSWGVGAVVLAVVVGVFMFQAVPLKWPGSVDKSRRGRPEGTLQEPSPAGGETVGAPASARSGGSQPRPADAAPDSGDRETLNVAAVRPQESGAPTADSGPLAPGSMADPAAGRPAASSTKLDSAPMPWEDGEAGAVPLPPAPERTPEAEAAVDSEPKPVPPQRGAAEPGGDAPAESAPADAGDAPAAPATPAPSEIGSAATAPAEPAPSPPASGEPDSTRPAPGEPTPTQVASADVSPAGPPADAPADAAAPSETVGPCCPEVLGRVMVEEGETVGEFIHRIYGAFQPQYLNRVAAANPHIHDLNNVLIGQGIRFPAVAMPLSAVASGGCWVVLSEQGELDAAYQVLRAYLTESVPVRLVPYWNKQVGLRFAVVLAQSFADRAGALAAAESLPRSAADGGVQIRENWGPEAVFFCRLE